MRSYKVIFESYRYSEAFDGRDGRYFQIYCAAVLYCCPGVLLCNKCSSHSSTAAATQQHSDTASHCSWLRGRRDTRWSIMNLDRVLSIPLCYSDYVKTAIDLCLSRDVKNKKLLQLAQNVCIVYSCLGVKRNGGTLSTEQKHREACKAFKEIAVPGFFKWARDNGHEFPKWLTMERMACTTMISGEKKHPYSSISRANRDTTYLLLYCKNSMSWHVYNEA